METYSNAGNRAISAFEHDVIGKAQAPVQYLLNFQDYDTLDQKGFYSATTADFFGIANNYNIGFYIDNGFEVGIGKKPVKGIRLDVAGKASFSDTLGLSAKASYGSNIHNTYTQYSLVDKSYSDSMGTTLHYSHTIFAPTGGAVTLVNNQYNIINPSGPLGSLTVNLPSSPANNDAVIIKYIQAITTVTYSGGTVVGGIGSPTAGGMVILTYDSGTSTWY
jgi:hypothetical protein